MAHGLLAVGHHLLHRMFEAGMENFALLQAAFSAGALAGEQVAVVIGPEFNLSGAGERQPLGRRFARTHFRHDLCSFPVVLTVPASPDGLPSRTRLASLRRY